MVQLAGAIAALGMLAAPIGAQGPSEDLPTWVERATDVAPKASVISRIRRPAMKSYTDSYIYGVQGTPGGVTFAATIDPEGYDEAVTMYLYWQDRVSEQKRYYNVPAGGFSTNEIDLFSAGGAPVQVFVPEIADLVFFAPSGTASAFGPLAGVPSSTGQYQLVLEIRSSDGSATVNFTNAMYSYVDAVIPKAGTIGSETWTANNAYLVGVLDVGAGAMLTIEPGTFVLGDNASQGRLAVLQDAMIMAQGTELRPIVMTSEFPRAQRQKGDWGGVAMNGRGPCNQAQPPLGEGETGPFCGNNPNDNSGVLSYVRIEYAGIRFTDDNELNGLAAQGLGAGTTLDHIQVTEGLDDGVEFFGGNVDINYLLVLNAEDDSLDWTFGWTGNGMMICLVQNWGEADKIIEGDNFEDDPTATPRARPTLTNFVGVSNATQGSSANADDTLVIRRGSGVILNNAALYTANGTAAVHLGDGAGDPTYDLVGTSELQFSGVQVFPLNALLIERDDNEAISAPAGLANGNPRLANPASPIQPDLQPLGGATSCTTANNDWTKAYWINWDYGVRN